jgi:hypothetical protein
MSTSPLAEPKKKSRARMACWLIGVAVVAPFAVAYVYYATSGRGDAEQDAQEYVLMGGYTNRGYEHTLFSICWHDATSWIVAYLPGSGRSASARRSRPLGVRDTAGVGFSRERMTDEMARHLVNIPNLRTIVLYPPHPDGSGWDWDFEATLKTKIRSLNQLRLPLSTASMAMLEAQFPDIEIYIAERPPANADSETDGDGKE